MAQGAIWFERKFDFPVSQDLLPHLYERLRAAPGKLERALDGVSREVLVHKPAPGAWSAQEQTGHLADMEPLWLARVEDYVAGSGELTPADLQNRKTHEANHNARALADILAEFRSAREKLLGRVQEVNPAAFVRAIPHPRLRTPMRLADHLYFVAEHDEHHLGKIRELIRAKA